MSTLVHPVTRYTVAVTFEVTVKARSVLTFTDQDVREWADLDGSDLPDSELTEEYMLEALSESDMDVIDVKEWQPLGAMAEEFEFLSTERVMTAPPEFVPLPGMDGDFTT